MSLCSTRLLKMSSMMACSLQGSSLSLLLYHLATRQYKMNDTITLSTARVFDLYNQDWVGITCTGNLGVPLAVFVLGVVYLC